MAKFKVHARVLDLLGFEQIADMPTAVSELFKNAYDAYADNVVLELFRHKQHAILWDDGVGMSHNEIENRWLVVGTPSKKLSRPPVRKGYKRRPVMGEKGIGRLAVSTIGDTLLLISKKKSSKPDTFTSLFLNWKVARNHKLMLDEFEVPVLPFKSMDEFTDDIFEMLVDKFRQQLKTSEKAGKWKKYKSLLAEIRSDIDSFKPDLSLFCRTGAFTSENGTAFYIGSVTDEIQCLTKPKNRHDTTDKSVFDQIVLLLSNFSKSRIDALDTDQNSNKNHDLLTDVRIWNKNLNAPSSIFEDQLIFQPDDLEKFDHFFDIQFDESGRYSGKILRYGKSLDLPSPEQQPVTRKLKCGPFGFRFWYWQGKQRESTLPQDTWSRIRAILRYSGGVMIYRDGLRVLPYGIPENDWLEIEERRSKGLGYYFFSYRRMFGYVTIDIKNNPQLKDKAGREGLIKSPAYRDFTSTLETFLRQISAQYFYKNEDFRSQQTKIIDENNILQRHKKNLEKRRADLLNKLKKSLSNIDRQRTRLVSLKNEIVQKLTAQNLSIDEMEEAVSSFEKRIQQILGESRVSIPKNLSLGRNRELNQVAFDYKKSFEALKMEANSVRDDIIFKAEKDFPSIQSRLARRKVLENTLSTGKMRIGQEFKKIKELIETKTDAISERVDEIKAESLSQVETALIEATGTTSIEEAITAEKGMEKAVKMTVKAADAGETKGLELLEQLSFVFNKGLSEDKALILSLQDDRIEDLEKKIQETVELAQIGLSVEMIQHDLHNMYRGISGSIRTLRHMLAKSPEAMTQINSLQSTFQHLELRYRQLEPLYRASYRIKKRITGKDIINFVEQFLSHDLDVAGVSIKASNSFISFSIHEAPALIHPVFVNLVDNSIYWLRSMNKRTIYFNVIDETVVVNDSGPGIHETMLERIFEAFTTTKQNGRGLGLYIARQSLALANHEIWATNDSSYKVEPGACFCVKFSQRALKKEEKMDDNA